MNRATMIALLAVSVCSPCGATVTEYLNKQQWQAAAGAYTTIPFTGFPDGTLITTQYSHLGLTFTDGLDLIYLNNSFPNDGAGLNGALDSIAIDFQQPITSLAVEYPGGMRIQLYSRGQLIYTSQSFIWGGIGNFGGLISTDSFDSAIIFDPLGVVNIDDLFFGPPIPAPGTLTLLSVTALVIGKRRRMQ